MIFRELKADKKVIRQSYTTEMYKSGIEPDLQDSHPLHQRTKSVIPRLPPLEQTLTRGGPLGLSTKYFYLGNLDILRSSKSTMQFKANPGLGGRRREHLRQGSLRKAEMSGPTGCRRLSYKAASSKS
jgi:hypothetical protein